MGYENWQPDADPDVVRQAMRRVVPGAPPAAPPQPGGAPLPQASPVSTLGQVASGARPPVSPAPQPVAQPTPQPAAPKPTDDPSLMNQAKPLLDNITAAGDALSREGTKVTDLQSRMTALKPPNYQQDYQPHGWKKALGIGLGLIPLAPTQLASAELEHIPQYNRANNEYERNRTSLMDQLAAEREAAVPLANDKARVSQEALDNIMKLAREKREQTAFQNEPTGRMPEMRTGPDGQPHYYQKTKGGEEMEVPEPREQAEDRRKREEDAATPAPGARPEPDPANKGKYRVKTKSGGYMPWAPKTVEEGALAGDKTATALFNTEHFHEAAQNNGGMSAAQQREYNDKTKPLQRQIDAIEKEKSEYQKSLAMGMLTGQQFAGTPAVQKHISDLEAKQADLHKQMDDAEQEILSRGGKGAGGKTGASGTKGESFKVPAGAPAPVKRGQYLKMDGKAVAYSEDGKSWGAMPTGK